MASAFFCGELGAGLFLVSLYYDVVLGMIFGLAITGILKTFFHLQHMGVPLKSWRAILRPDRAWVSCGLLTIIVFTAFGTLQVRTGSFGMFDMENSVLLTLIRTIAALAALGVMVYHGFAMSDSTAISLWDTRLMPLISIVYALLGGAVLAMVLGWPTVAGEDPTTILSLHKFSLLLVLLNAVLISSLLYGAFHGSPGARVSAELLLKGLFSRHFIPLVFVGGLAIPLLFLFWAPGSVWVSLVVAVTMLSGYYAFRLYILRAGVFEPIMDFSPPGLLE